MKRPAPPGYSFGTGESSRSTSSEAFCWKGAWSTTRVSFGWAWASRSLRRSSSRGISRAAAIRSRVGQTVPSGSVKCTGTFGWATRCFVSSTSRLTRPLIVIVSWANRSSHGRRAMGTPGGGKGGEPRVVVRERLRGCDVSDEDTELVGPLLEGEECGRDDDGQVPDAQGVGEVHGPDLDLGAAGPPVEEEDCSAAGRGPTP